MTTSCKRELRRGQRFKEAEVVLDIQDSRFLRPFTRILPEFLQHQRWFAGKAKRVSGCDARDIFRLTPGPNALYFFLIRVDYIDSDSQFYALPLQEIEDPAQAAAAETGGFGFRIEPENGESRASSVVFGDAMRAPEFAAFLLEFMARGEAIRGLSGELTGSRTTAFERLRGPEPHLDSRLISAEQSNTSIAYGDRLILKVFRQLEEGISPEIETCSFLTEHTSFAHFAAVAGSLDYRQPEGESISLGVLQRFVPNDGDAWKYTIRAVDDSFDRVLPSGVGAPGSASTLLLPRGPRGSDEMPPGAQELIGDYLSSAELLARRTAELHLALASDSRHPDFAPEPFASDYQQFLESSLMALLHQNLRLLRDRAADLSGKDLELAESVLRREADIRSELDRVTERRMTALRTRVHGDYHLGQVLHTGSDFVIVDFEGEPARPLHERRMKHSALRDVAGMLRSFHYAAYSALFARTRDGESRPGSYESLEARARCWHAYVSAAFLRTYLRVAAPGSFLPPHADELRLLLGVLLLEKAVYELGYELNHRPTWVRIPLEGILQTVAEQAAITGAS